MLPYRRREKNLGSSNNMRQMYIDFLETGDDVLVNCDSDMIFRSDWITKVFQLLSSTEGVLGLYNSSQHLPLDHIKIGMEKFVRKESLGAAGTVFTREIVQNIVENVKPSFKYDWDWSSYLVVRFTNIFTNNVLFGMIAPTHMRRRSWHEKHYGLHWCSPT